MSVDCIFCAIAAGDAPGRIVTETDGAVAFLDANPLAAGHTLVVPRDHHERLGDCPPAVAQELFAVVHDLVPRVERAVGADGVTVGVNDGSAAGQEVHHCHVHLVPREHGDGGGPIHAAFGTPAEVSEARLDEIADAIRADG